MRCNTVIVFFQLVFDSVYNEAWATIYILCQDSPGAMSTGIHADFCVSIRHEVTKYWDRNEGTFKRLECLGLGGSSLGGRSSYFEAVLLAVRPDRRDDG